MYVATMTMSRVMWCFITFCMFPKDFWLVDWIEGSLQPMSLLPANQ